MQDQSDEIFYDPCENMQELSSQYQTITAQSCETFYAPPPASNCPSTPELTLKNSHFITKTEIISANFEIINRSKTISSRPKELCQFTSLRLVQEIDLIDKHENGTWIVKFCPERKAVAVGGQTGVICIYEIVNTRKMLLNETSKRVFTEHEGMITDIDWNQDGYIFTSSLDCTVKVWRKSQERSMLTIKHTSRVNAVCSNPACPSVFVTASGDSIIRLFRFPNPNPESLYKAPKEVTALAYSPSGEFLAAGLRKGEVIIYKSLPGSYRLRLKYNLKCRNRFGLKRGGRNVTSLEFMDEHYLLVSTNDSRIRLYNFKDNQLVQKYKGHANSHYPIKAGFSQHKAHVICGSERGSFFIWNTFKETEGESLEKNDEFEAFDARNNKGVEFACFAPDKVVESVAESYRNRELGEVTHIILSAGSFGTLRIFYNVT
ncbi:unnamed protein product [Blepharisma stoltei]|uniref:Uncharacterized protein n=1 Tax=Blepharisma stoltei TaxID=1481888 RepID=A0AAU9JFK4_9CILI|nr:unnamed protein product [Blepharisma stoltei]